MSRLATIESPLVRPGERIPFRVPLNPYLSLPFTPINPTVQVLNANNVDVTATVMPGTPTIDVDNVFVLPPLQAGASGERYTVTFQFDTTPPVSGVTPRYRPFFIVNVVS